MFPLHIMAARFKKAAKDRKFLGFTLVVENSYWFFFSQNRERVCILVVEVGIRIDFKEQGSFVNLCVSFWIKRVMESNLSSFGHGSPVGPIKKMTKWTRWHLYIRTYLVVSTALKSSSLCIFFQDSGHVWSIIKSKIYGEDTALLNVYWDPLFVAAAWDGYCLFVCRLFSFSGPSYSLGWGRKRFKLSTWFLLRPAWEDEVPFLFQQYKLHLWPVQVKL